LNRLGAVVGRAVRTTNFNNSGNGIGGTALRVLSVRAPIVAGRTYRVVLQAEVFRNSGSSSDFIAESSLRYTTNDTEPTTSSTVLARALVHCYEIAVPETVNIVAYYPSSTTGFLRVAWTLNRADTDASGACTASAGATFPTTLTIEDAGDTVQTSGTVY